MAILDHSKGCTKGHIRGMHLLARAAGVGAVVLLVGVALSGVRQQAALEQDGMAIGSGGMPLSLDATQRPGADEGSGEGRKIGNPLLNALESSVDAAREVRQEMGGTSMRMSAGRAALRRLPPTERRRDTARATQTLKNYMAQRAQDDAEARDTLNNYIAQEMRSAEGAQSTQLAAQAPPEVSGMSLGSGGRPLPMHLPEAVSWKQDPAQKAKMLALFDRLSPQTKQLLLDQQGDLAEAVKKVEKQMMTSRSMRSSSRTEMLWNAQETAPYNPMQRVSHFDAESSKVNKMIARWNAGADRAPAGSDY
jgi:hypothetical protein